jgi:hypothetical protein
MGSIKDARWRSNAEDNKHLRSEEKGYTPVGVEEQQNKEMVVKPSHYMQFGVEVDKICQWVLNHEDNAHLDKWEAAKMCDELEYRLRAGFKTGCYKEDMEKAMNINKNRKEYKSSK